MTTYLVCPANPARGIQRRALKVLMYDRSQNLLVFQWPDGRESRDTNFHIDIVKRCGYILTAEVPSEFRR